MAHYIFVRSAHPNAGWELLEKVEREILANEVFYNYQQRFKDEKEILAMVEAPNLLAGQALLNDKDPEFLRERFSARSVSLPWRHKSSCF